VLAEREAARSQAEQHERQRKELAASLAEFDSEAALIAELTTIRKLVAGEVQAGSRDGLESFRTALARLFVGFELLSAERSDALAGKGAVASGADGSALALEGGYALLPYIRQESVRYGNAEDFAAGFPAVRQAALSFRDNFQARLAAW
jgi:hypothetical protein